MSAKFDILGGNKYIGSHLVGEYEVKSGFPASGQYWDYSVFPTIVCRLPNGSEASNDTTNFELDEMGIEWINEGAYYEPEHRSPTYKHIVDIDDTYALRGVLYYSGNNHLTGLPFAINIEIYDKSTGKAISSSQIAFLKWRDYHILPEVYDYNFLVLAVNTYGTGSKPIVIRYNCKSVASTGNIYQVPASEFISENYTYFIGDSFNLTQLLNYDFDNLEQSPRF